MSDGSLISLRTWVSERESVAVGLAAQAIARALSEAAQAAWKCEVNGLPHRAGLTQGAPSEIVLTSLLPELARTGEPWPVVEADLRAHFRAVTAVGSPVFICTVLRTVPLLEAPEKVARLERIGRLNLLAVEISHETGAFVIDVDRVLAHIGAGRLGTDHCLISKPAVETVGHFVALSVIENGVDGLVSFEIQDAARTLMEASKPTVALLEADRPAVTLRKNLMVMGRGRQRQTVAPVAFTVQKSYAGWLVRQVVRGKFSPADVWIKLTAAIRRRGLRESAAMLFSGLAGQLKSRK